MANLRCVLLDANIIIELYNHEVWDLLQQRVTLIIPSIVRAETRYTPEYVPIDLEPAFNSNTLQEISATVEQMAAVHGRFDRVFIERLDPGETEALAIMLNGTLGDCQFCTGDGPAIKALAMLDLADAGIALESLLREVGLSRKVARPFTERFFHDKLEEGKEAEAKKEAIRNSCSEDWYF